MTHDEEHSKKEEEEDNPVRRAFVFPGQGSQTVGMGRALAEYYHVARQVFQEVDDALNIPLYRLMTEGPEEELSLTENAQPAILATSTAVLRVLESEWGHTLASQNVVMAGHSLGEYSALVAAQALPLEHAARLVRLRGKTMQEAVPPGQGLMAAILGMEEKNLETITEHISAQDPQNHMVVIANDNAPGQIVISGHKNAVEEAIEQAKNNGCKRAIPLNTSAPFHSPLMRPVESVMSEIFETTPLTPTLCPVVFNVTASPPQDMYTIFPLLIQQICGRVRWRESILWMAQNNFHEIIELGCGKVLSGLTARIDRSLQRHAIETPEDIWNFLRILENSTSQEP